MEPVLIGAVLVMLLGGAFFYLFPGLAYGAVIHTIRWWGRLNRHEVRAGDHRWVYLLGGQGENILFIHGFGADKDRWSTFLPAFSGSFRVIAPDLPGFGESSKIASADYDIPHQVNRLHRFVTDIGLDSFHLVGVSMGGYIAAYYAGEHPDRVNRLVLLDAAGVASPVSSTLRDEYEKTGNMPLLYRTPEEFQAMMEVVFFRPPWLPYRYKVYFAAEGKRNHAFHQKVLEDMFRSGMDLLEGRLHLVEAETLILWGAEDRVIHVSSVEKFEQGVKRSRIAILEKTGHVPYVERAGETKKIVRTFLQESG